MLDTSPAAGDIGMSCSSHDVSYVLLQVLASIGSTDFSKVVKGQNAFADKTLFIKEFLDDDPQDPMIKVITAPAKFGKSLTIDMVKRFLTIPVDSKGNRIAPQSTDNYRLFCDNKLRICENETFTTEHFGRYPVIHINYHNLASVNNYSSFLSLLRTIIRLTFVEHDYLQHNQSLFEGNRDLFINHCSMSGVLDPEEMVVSFKWLLNLLAAHFQSKVVILIDEYDAFATEVLFGNVDHAEKIVQYLNNVSAQLFDNNKIHKALVTGILRVKEFGLLPPDRIYFPNNKSEHFLRYYRWLGDHRYSKYFGFTMDEVSDILKIHIREAKRRRQIKRHSRLFYSGYNVQYQSTKLFNPWSMVHFIECRRKPSNYWCATSRFNELVKFILTDTKNLMKIKRLLVDNRCIYTNITEPFDMKDIIGIKELKKNNRLLVAMFDLGFLIPGRQMKSKGAKYLTPLRIPNIEINMEFSRMLMRDYVNQYDFNTETIKVLHSIVDSFKYNKNNTKRYHRFYSTMNYLIRESKHYPKTRFEFHILIFAMLASSFPCGRRYTTSVSSLTCDVDSVPGLLKKDVKFILDKYASKRNKTKKTSHRKKSDIILRNAEKMGIVIELGFKDSKEERELDELAIFALSEIFVSYDPTFSKLKTIKFEGSSIRPKGKIYIGIAYDMTTRRTSMAFYSPMYDGRRGGPLLVGRP